VLLSRLTLDQRELWTYAAWAECINSLIHTHGHTCVQRDSDELSFKAKQNFALPAGSDKFL
jgi:hypothetical protein